MKMNFRTAEIKDFDTVFMFIQKLWDYNTYDYEETKALYAHVLSDEASRIFLIEDEKGTHGFCHWNYYDTFWLSGKTCYLSGFFVNEEDRGKGYGKAAVAYLKESAKAAGCRGIILESGLPRTKTHAFYENQGFEKSCYGFEYIL